MSKRQSNIVSTSRRRSRKADDTKYRRQRERVANILKKAARPLPRTEILAVETRVFDTIALHDISISMEIGCTLPTDFISSGSKSSSER